MSAILYAHIHKESDRREPLFAGEESHARLTALRAGAFAEAMVPPGHAERVAFLRAAGRLLGYWHDLGKGSREFQKYLLSAEEDAHALEKRGRVDHSSAGAQHAAKQLPGLGTLLAFAIAGHHAGLPDWQCEGESGLKSRLQKPVKPWQEEVPPEFLSATGLPNSLPCPAKGFSCAFLTRMLFSCLTDADFLATEHFMNPDQSDLREKVFPSLADLAEHLEAHLAKTFPSAATEVQRRRRQVVDHCRQAAPLPPGFFSLNVPTGGGKTLSSLVFALKHAVCHQQRRVICAIPFTSIIEQNARVYREVFDALGEGIVLEHHASLDAEDPTVMGSRLAAENWDAPIVVTTNVQFFETLFANRPGRCRKLHRIARSVIVLDEAQALPVDLLEPCLRALQELVTHYGCSVVLCTATQPALEKRENFKIGLSHVREIIPDTAALHAALRRVRVEVAGKLTLEGTAAQLMAQERVLAIVNTRKHARELYEILRKETGGEGCFHLSALMCPEHRTRKLKEIKARLQSPNAPCRVVSTQLVEAGVDIDFPVVYRSLAGLDAIAQAAGRCNREGQLEGLGITRVFQPAESRFLLPGDLKQAAGHAGEVMALPDYQENLLSMAAIEHYFKLHYWHKGGELGEGWDRNKIMYCFKLGDTLANPFLFQFRQAASEFQLIEDVQEPVIIPWDEKALKMIQDLRAQHHPEVKFLAKASRVLQRYVVSVPRRERRALEEAMAVETLHERFCVLLDRKNYSEETGVIVPKEAYCDPEKLIVS
ncbi:MAG: CRISPR-associated helicase Cas3' [Magnetococcales bacterium]|nr:CRISPR-associated helicase Cas3' [Magnetococcales bacterium]